MKTMKKIVVFTGAGVSAESGLKTFRDSDGLWENYNVMEVATPEAWEANPEMVLDFYNQRRRQLHEVEPNEAHCALAELEQHFDVQIITQNIDDLHERAGSTNVLHLHGELKKARSTAPPYDVFDIKSTELNIKDICPRGFQLRPHVVWFGEAVPMLPKAQELCTTADIFIVVGTSLNVYPAASLVFYAPETAKKFLVDPKEIHVSDVKNMEYIKATAGAGVPDLVSRLIKEKAELV